MFNKRRNNIKYISTVYGLICSILYECTNKVTILDENTISYTGNVIRFKIDISNDSNITIRFTLISGNRAKITIFNIYSNNILEYNGVIYPEFKGESNSIREIMENLKNTTL